MPHIRGFVHDSGRGNYDQGPRGGVVVIPLVLFLANPAALDALISGLVLPLLNCGEAEQKNQMNHHFRSWEGKVEEQKGRAGDSWKNKINRKRASSKIQPSCWVL